MSNQFSIPSHSINDFIVGEPVFTFAYKGISHSYITHVGANYVTLSEFGTQRFAPSSIYKLNEIIKVCFDFARETKNKFDTNAVNEAQIKVEKYFNKPIWLIYYIDLPQFQTNKDTPVFFIEKVGVKGDDYFDVENYIKKIVDLQTGNKSVSLAKQCWVYNFYNEFCPTTRHYGAHLSSPKINFNKRTKVCDMESKYWFGVDKIVYNMRNEPVGTFKGSIEFWGYNCEEYWNTFDKYSNSISIIRDRDNTRRILSPKNN